MIEKWFIKNKKADFALIAKNFGISPVLARLAINRGIASKEQLEQYLKPSFEYLHNPKRLGACIGQFKKEGFPPGEFSYIDCTVAYDSSYPTKDEITPTHTCQTD